MQLAECYKILNVLPGEEWHKVRKSYHSLARQLHPDINQSKSHFDDSRLKQINQAFAKLETHYKASGLSVYQEKGGREQTKWKSWIKVVSSNPAVQSAINASLNLLENLDDKVFQLDIHKDIKLSRSILQKGGSLNLKSGKERIEVKIPSGEWNQMSLKIEGKGESSLFSKRRGDLILNLHVPSSFALGLENSCFSYEMKVPSDQIADKKVLTLNSSEGPIKFVLPIDTRDGQTFTLRSGGSHNVLHRLTVRLD